MKKLLVASVVAGLVGTANAQSAFEGFFGQVGVGYESVDANMAGSGTITGSTGNGRAYTLSSGNANSFTGNVAIGSYFSVTPTFLIGIGAEYSPLTGSSENYTLNLPAVSYTETGSWKKKNSYNIFLSPAYALESDK